MKIGSFFIAVLLLGGTTLFARALTQGVESALVATAIEWSMRRIKFFGYAKQLARRDRVPSREI
jgi:hypothetical protein